MNAAPARAKPSLSIVVALVLAVALHFVSARWHVLHGGFNADEGFYAIATRSVAQGEMPYRDFGFTQPPLVPYLNALPLRVFGFGLFSQRAVNGGWAAVALGCAAVWLARRTHPRWGIALALLFSLSAPWMYFTHLGKTYGVTTLLVMLDAWVFLALPPGPRRNLLLGGLGALGFATRLPATPFFAVLWLLALFPGRLPARTELFAACSGAIAMLVVLALPFAIAAPKAARFWVFDFHRASVPLKDWSVDWSEIACLAPAVWVLAVAGVAVIALRRQFTTPEAGVVLASLTALAANLLPVGAYQEYGTPFLLPLAAASLKLLHDALRDRRGVIGAIALVAIAAHGLTAPLRSTLSQSPRGDLLSRWLPPQAPPYNATLPQEVEAAARLVERSLPADQPFIGPNIILAAETGRFVPRELRMGPFSFTVEIPPERARRLHLVTHETLDAWFADPRVTLLAFFQRRELNYGWSMPSFDQLKPDFHAQWFAPLQRDFSPAYDSAEFVLLVRKPPQVR
jgi:hypothetical protein